MRHSKRTVNEAMMAFDTLDRLGISNIVPVGFQPVKYGDRTFGQLEAFENKVTTAGFDQILSDQATITPVHKPEASPAPEPLASFFQATKGSETANSVLFHVRIKRGKRSAQQLLDLTGRKPYTNNDVVPTMPLINGELADWEELDFEMFKVGERISDEQVEKERTTRDSIRDLEVQVLINVAFREFADEHPNGDSWTDADGNWCFAYFCRRGGGRYVSVRRRARVWVAARWFGGRKVSK